VPGLLSGREAQPGGVLSLLWQAAKAAALATAHQQAAAGQADIAVAAADIDAEAQRRALPERASRALHRWSIYMCSPLPMRCECGR
jgi:hypothetical protein